MTETSRPQLLVHPLRADYSLASQAFLALKQKLWPEDPAVAGKHLDTCVFDVTSGLLHEYAHRMGIELLEPNVAPATLLFAHAHREVASWYLPRLAGNLHVRQEWEFFAAAVVGERLRATRTISERYMLSNGREVVVCDVTILRDIDNTPVAKSRTHQSFAPAQRRERPRAAQSASVDKEASVQETSLAQPFLGPRLTLDQRACNNYVGLDPGGRQQYTYHNWWPAARALGFPRVVVQGTHGVSLINDLLERRFGLEWRQGGSLDVRFVSVVWMDDVVQAGAKVRRQVVESNNKVRCICDVWLEKQDGVRAIMGSASVLLSSAARL